MSTRVVIVTEIIAPYRIPVFNALAARDSVDLHVIFLSETDPALRQWQVYRDEIRFSFEVLKSHRWRLGRFNALVTRGVRRALDAKDPEVVLAGGYNYLATWQAQSWARSRRVPFVLWSESNIADKRRNFPWVETAKRHFIQRCQSFVVPGTSAAAYLATFGVEQKGIYVAPNAIDLERYALAAETARRDPELRARLRLPLRYLLFVGRFVHAKGVYDLLEAYAKLPGEARRAVGLVMAGDGEEREELVRRSRDIHPGEIFFPGFLQREDLVPYYGLAEALVLPTHSDTWGFVVNEAMACGVPVIATRVAGCVADMVQDGENGFVVDARDPSGLARAMEKMITASAETRDCMRRTSREIGARFNPEAWADGVLKAVRMNVGASRG